MEGVARVVEAVVTGVAPEVMEVPSYRYHGGTAVATVVVQRT